MRGHIIHHHVNNKKGRFGKHIYSTLIGELAIHDGTTCSWGIQRRHYIAAAILLLHSLLSQLNRIRSIALFITTLF